MTRISKGNNMRRTNRSITRTKSWTNKRSLEACPWTHPNPQEKGVKETINKVKNHVGLTSVHAMRKKLWPLNESSTEKSHKSNSHKNQAHEKHWSKVGEPFSDSSHVSRATGVHQPHVLQSSVQHLHRTRRGRWFSAGVSEINLRNLPLNHVTWGSLHCPLHLSLWTSGMRTTTGKTWTIQVFGFKAGVRLSSRKTMPTREMITTMRTWAVTKVSRHKAVLSWTKTIRVMVRSMRETRRSTRRCVRWSTRVRMRQKINELITIWVSSIIKAHLLNSLVTRAKLIQVTSTATKHAHKSFLFRLGGFFPHLSLGLKDGFGLDG
jgi:hypothetical protein